MVEPTRLHIVTNVPLTGGRQRFPQFWAICLPGYFRDELSPVFSPVVDEHSLLYTCEDGRYEACARHERNFLLRLFCDELDARRGYAIYCGPEG